MTSYVLPDRDQSRSLRQLLRLRLLTGSQTDAGLPAGLSTEVRDATNAIIAEAEATSRAAIGAGEERDPQAETFLWVRIARLAAAADKAVDAARSRDVHALRAQLQRFDALLSALWAVQRATGPSL
jgi:hypothetical protein